MKKTKGHLASLSAKGLRIGILASRFNRVITKKLLDGTTQTLKKCGIEKEDIEICWVPGAFEIPFALQQLARTKKYHALIALGAVVRGETPHFNYVAGEAARGAMQVSLNEGIPVAFGVLTTNNMAQAMERAGGRHGNKGMDAALVAIEMARLMTHGK